MGFNIKTSELLIYSKSFGVDFSSVLTIGRQRLHGYHFLFQKLFTRKGFPSGSYERIFLEKDRYAEDFLKILGAKMVDSIDASDYESASIIHDMNKAIPESLKNSYSLVIDSGSLEHIFNFPQAIKNCMEMIQVGGHFIGVTPTNNFLGHGFYQFSPELFYRVFTSENGFELKKMLLFFDEENSPVYEVSDPLQVRARVKLKNAKESFLFVIAEKIEQKEIFKQIPQQSDYEHLVWENASKEKAVKKEKGSFFMRNKIPGFLVIKLLALRKWLYYWKTVLNPIGDGDKKQFKKFKLD